MKAIITSIQPYYVFLIIARIMGWNIPQEKMVEVRKDYPKDSAWNKVVKIYCSKNRKSFNRIPKEYQPLMQQFLGKVVGEFACDRVDEFVVGSPYCDDIQKQACLTYEEMIDYFYKHEELDGKTVKFGYGWHVSDLKIYDTPKELGEFANLSKKDWTNGVRLIRPPQSWCYVEELE